MQDILQESFCDVVDFRFGAAVMALQKLFRVYLLSPTLSYAAFRLSPSSSGQ